MNEPPPIPAVLDEPPAPEEQRDPVLVRPPERGTLRCPDCGGEIAFDPAATELRCPYCGHAEAIAAGGAVEERDLEATLAREAAHAEQETVEGLEQQVRCPGCGASILMGIGTATDECPYCGTDLANAPAAAERMIAPNAVLPFRITAKQARTAFQAWIDGLWFAPGDLRRKALAGEIDGLYVPFWTYDAMTYSAYRGQRGDDYTESRRRTVRNAAGEMESKLVSVTKTRWRRVSGRVDTFFDDVLVLASASLPPEYVHELEPWDLDALVDYDPKYLAGFRTERYRTDLKTGFVQAKEVMDARIRTLCRRDIGGDRQKLASVDTQYAALTFKHLLLPVWHGVYHYGDRVCRVVVNARTGEVQGDRPTSYWKVAGAVLLALLVVGIVAAVAGAFGR